MHPTLLLKPFAQLPDEEKKRHFDFLYSIFGAAYNEMVWASTDWVIQVFLQDQLISLVEIIERTVRVGDQDILVGGVSGVSTLTEYRRRGFASLAVKEAGRFLSEDLKVSFGLLLTRAELEPFYGRLGWRRFYAPIICDQPGARVTLDGVAMFLPCTENVWPPGPVDFCGLPW